ncbi:uncharacterized protein K460DRAFT_105913 [Cucurbitaria berberidis CBS 394.84]|uniref:Uncharacterized protein n=1 Tax=Cucurbitaria berberidis CBS 394.84 TaxID=1168544 RepID=A0A9P4GGN8_9PLEO|nr:uncharacterized protein K460DRAFT_105913 [Cucurbitaria berberidis CBS 394.84]KAF1845282.1 hypothetical protein K460DRAFT_105913 [Cucurbitaria berberidis CBS 394.84]
MKCQGRMAHGLRFTLTNGGRLHDGLHPKVLTISMRSLFPVPAYNRLRGKAGMTIGWLPPLSLSRYSTPSLDVGRRPKLDLLSWVLVFPCFPLICFCIIDCLVCNDMIWVGSWRVL